LANIKAMLRKPIKEALKKPYALFPRVESQERSQVEIKTTSNKEDTLEITIEEFQKMDLRVGVILNAEDIPKSNKLLKLTVDVGETREIVAGIKGHFLVDELKGKQVVVVTNLKPTKLMGVESRGMVLAAVDEKGELALISPTKEMKPGSKVR